MILEFIYFQADFWSEMAREVKSSFGSNGLKKSNHATAGRGGIRGNSNDGSDITARYQ